ncbi:MAG TPA: glutathione S-transferase family protein [Gammaproteobacteria bacterium]|jgi:glutathione S-transferase|nr:glutathione S-transferase family protein [Gammaproteobacteria bacterium]
MLTIYVFGNVPRPVIGVTRDLRVLWTAEEAGVPYRVHALDHARGELKAPEYLALNPFGKVPAIDDDGLTLFESGAIVLHLAAKTDWLLPTSPQERARATQWAFATVDTVQPPMTDLFVLDKFHSDKAWAAERRPALMDSARRQLAALERELAARPYLLGDAFTAPDILLSSALRTIQHTDLLDGAPNIADYKARCEARSAWRKIYAAYEQRLAA